MKLTLHNADCMDIMAQYDDNYFDLAIVDPPYGIGENGGTNSTRGKMAKPADYKPFAGADESPPSKQYFYGLTRVSKDQIIWGANHMCGVYSLQSSCWIVWDKDNSGNFADCELAWTSFPSAVRKFKWRWNGMLQERMGKEKEYRAHPTQKPLPLMRWIIEKYSQPDQIILDPFAGSGTTLVAAKQLGRRYIGIEINPDYCKIAEQRLAQEQLPL